MRGNKFFTAIDRYAGIALILILRAAGILLYPFSLFRRHGSDILVIKFSAMGDTILLLPVLRRLRIARPGSKITMIVTSVNSGVLENSAFVDELIVFDLKWLKNPVQMVRFISRLRKKKFGLAVDFDQWLRISPLLAFLSGAKKRYGFRTRGQGRHFLYTRSIRHAGPGHEIDRFFALLKEAGVGQETGDRNLFFEVSDSDKKEADAFLAKAGVQGKPYVVLHPGCGAHGFRRQWPEESYAILIRKLQESGYTAKLSAGPGEEEVCLNINKAMGQNNLIIRGAKLGVLAALIKGAAFFVSGNTGVMHLAAAVDTPLIALHGPTDAERWGPLGSKSIVIKSGIPCSPCLYLGSEYGCEERRCMETITVDMVLAAVKSIENKG